MSQNVVTGTRQTSLLTRRQAFQGFGGAVAATLLTSAAVQSVSTSSQGDDLAATPAPAGTTEPRVREFELVAEEFDWPIMEGVTARMWGYNGQTPGPEIRVTEGDLVRVTLTNRLSVPTTVHWHGIHLRPEMDGPAGLNQAAVEPGDTFVYEFIATPAGTRWYHSHADPQLQVPMGLYGPLIVEPRTPLRRFDREYTLMLGEWDSELTPDVAAGRAERGPRDRTLRGGELGADMYLINGHAHGAIPPIVVREGERVRIRVINCGHLAHPVHLHGHSFELVATDGNEVPVGMAWLKDTVLVGPAERYDLELDANNPGVWMVHCHIEHHMANGMMTVLQYEGHRPTGPAAETFDETVTGHAGHGAPEPAPTQEATPAAAPATQAPTGAGTVEVALIDARFDPPTIDITAGTTVSWTNRGSDLHSVASSTAGFSSEKLAPGENYTFAFEEPGDHRVVCLHHALAGMSSTVTVT